MVGAVIAALRQLRNSAFRERLREARHETYSETPCVYACKAWVVCALIFFVHAQAGSPLLRPYFPGGMPCAVLGLLRHVITGVDAAVSTDVRCSQGAAAAVKQPGQQAQGPVALRQAPPPGPRQLECAQAAAPGGVHLVALGLVAVAAEHGGAHGDARHERQRRRRRRQGRPVRRRRRPPLPPLPRQVAHPALRRLLPRLRAVPAAQGAMFLTKRGRSKHAQELGTVHKATDRQLADASLRMILAGCVLSQIEKSQCHYTRKQNIYTEKIGISDQLRKEVAAHIHIFRTYQRPNLKPCERWHVARNLRKAAVLYEESRESTGAVLWQL